jgi:hypothetical protein
MLVTAAIVFEVVATRSTRQFSPGPACMTSATTLVGTQAFPDSSNILLLDNT